MQAGHPAPIHIGQGGCTHVAGSAVETPIGLPIPLTEAGEVNHLTLATGDRLVFHSDGLSELMTPDGRWLPDELLAESLAARHDRPLGPCLDEVVRDLGDRTGRTVFEDDATIVALERRAD